MQLTNTFPASGEILKKKFPRNFYLEKWISFDSKFRVDWLNGDLFLASPGELQEDIEQQICKERIYN